MKIKTFYFLIIGIVFLTSCSKQASDDTLSGHLLMAPFTSTSYSGKVMDENLNALSEASDEESITMYKSIFALPYKQHFAEQAKAILLKDYNATDKASTTNAIDKLAEDVKSLDFKAYTYACAVNVANLAYASGYMTKEDVSKIEQNVLIEAKSNYSSWTTYLEDFLKGREKFLKEDPNNSQQLFEIVVNEVLLKNENSPFLKLGFPTS